MFYQTVLSSFLGFYRRNCVYFPNPFPIRLPSLEILALELLLWLGSALINLLSLCLISLFSLFKLLIFCASITLSVFIFFSLILRLATWLLDFSYFFFNFSSSSWLGFVDDFSQFFEFLRDIGWYFWLLRRRD
jgi:hypothetical protein